LKRVLTKQKFNDLLAIIFWCLVSLWWVGLSAAGEVKSIKVIIEGLVGQEREAVQKALEVSQDLITEGMVDEEWLKRLERQGPQKIRQALEPFGYYKPDVTVKLEPSDEGLYRLVATVKAGEPVRVKSINLIVDGPGAHEPVITKMIAEFPLRQGDRLRQDIYEEGKEDLQKKAVSIGYLDAAYSKHSIRVTLSQLSAEVDLVLETGPQYYFGDVTFEGQPGFPEPFLMRYLAFKRGETYSQEKIAQTQVNFVSADRFKMVTINGRRDEAKDNFVPMEITLVPLKQKRVKFGIGYGTDTGVRGSIRYQDFNILGRGQLFDAELKVSQIFQGLGARYVFPSNIDVKSLASIKLGWEHEKTTGSTTDKTIQFFALEGNLTRTFGSEKLGTVYLRLQQENSRAGNESTKAFLLMPGVQFSQNRYDSVTRPTKGFRYDLELRGTDQFMGSNTGFLQFLGRGEYLMPLPQRFSILTRMQVGATSENEPADDLPISVRFFAGGDNSVRGYKYQSLGPTDAFGTVVGGRNLLFGSIELHRAIGKDWAVAAFYDTGNAFDTWSRIDLAQGAGLGGLYYTVVGPIRLYVARQIGVRKPEYRIHIVVGIGL
jgi:translocation and assembly module TamA